MRTFQRWEALPRGWIGFVDRVIYLAFRRDQCARRRPRPAPALRGRR